MKHSVLDFETGKKEQLSWEVVTKLLNGACKKLRTAEDFADPNACRYLRDHLIKTKQQLFWSRGYAAKTQRHPVNSFVALGAKNLIPGTKQERIRFTATTRVYLNLGPRTTLQKTKDRKITAQTKALTKGKV